jgi:hypothetical protein
MGGANRQVQGREAIVKSMQLHYALGPEAFIHVTSEDAGLPLLLQVVQFLTRPPRLPLA